MCNTGKHIGPIRNKKEHSRQQKHAYKFLYLNLKSNHITAEWDPE